MLRSAINNSAEKLDVGAQAVVKVSLLTSWFEKTSNKEASQQQKKLQFIKKNKIK